MKNNDNFEKGYAIVEATIVYPIIILVFCAIFYAALFVYEKASLQASLEDSMIYYKSELTDTYIRMSDGMKDDKGSRIGNEIEKIKYKNPYRNIGSIAKSILGGLVGLDSKAELTGKVSKFINNSYRTRGIQLSGGEDKDYYFFKTIGATAVIKRNTLINIAMVGAKNSIDIGTKTTITVADPDNLIRDIDFVTDLAANTKLGRMIEEKKGQIKAGYENFIKKLKK